MPIERLVAVIANAGLVAGPAGSGMFNLAFQGRMRSAFLLAPAGYPSVSELLFSAGRSCALWYHFGSSVGLEISQSHDLWSVDPARLEIDLADWLQGAR